MRSKAFPINDTEGGPPHQKRILTGPREHFKILTNPQMQDLQFLQLLLQRYLKTKRAKPLIVAVSNLSAQNSFHLNVASLEQSGVDLDVQILQECV
jgi:hypothetical protein